MMSSGGWRSLDLSDAGTPKLLLKSQITSTGYHVQLTDLCRIWAEKLNKRDLIRRAWDDGCSIDPSEDDNQFSIFLEKLESALNGEDGTTMDVSHGDDGGLNFKLSAQLPKGFRTLVWTMLLSREPEDVLAETLTVPLLQQASGLQTQIQQLIHELQEKDRVISKITDRLETSGNDLTTVFPGVSNVRTNKKKSQREQLSRHVRGLADFDEAEWRSKSAASAAQGTDWKDFDVALRSLPEPDATEHLQMIKREWWHNVGNTKRPKSESTDPIPATPGTARVHDSMPGFGEETAVDDDFQRQATPDHLKETGTDDSPMDGIAGQTNAHVSQQPQQIDKGNGDGDSTTEDEDDLDAVSEHKPAAKSPKLDPTPPSRSEPKTSAAGPPKKLGALGGQPFKPSPSSARQPTPEEQPQAAKPRPKLGAIGGKAKAPQKSASPTPDVQAPPTSSVPRKMGIIGGKRKPTESEPQTATTSRASVSPEPVKDRSRAVTKQRTPPPRETSEERTNQKRMQLKKELEQKAKAPAKKKRKF